jgi:phosphoenolpyruvate carboxylase
VSNDQPTVEKLLVLVQRRLAQAAEDPFGNPVMSIALAITRQIDEDKLDTDLLLEIVRHLRDEAFRDRAARLASYVGGTDRAGNEAALEAVARTVLRPDPEDSPVRWAEFRASIERARYAAVFTAHPTFSLAPAAAAALAAAASGAGEGTGPASHRPPPISLQEEFTQAVAAIANARDALDRFNQAVFKTAAQAWPDRWVDLLPRPVVVASQDGDSGNGQNGHGLCQPPWRPGGRGHGCGHQGAPAASGWVCGATAPGARPAAR